MSARFSETVHVVNGLSPVADALAGTVNSDIVNMEGYGKCTFLVHAGVGTTGTSTFTVEASDDTSASNTTAIKFAYRQITSGDTHGALTNAAAAGYTNTAGSDDIEIIEVSAEDLSSTGYSYVRLHAVESANDPVLAGILIILSDPRFPQSVTDSAIT